MEPIASFGGLASGIDFPALVDQIISAESRPILFQQRDIAQTQSRSAAWEQFRNLVRIFDGAAEDLANGDAFRAFTTTLGGIPSGETPPVTVAAGSQAAPGNYSVKVLQTARNEKLGSDVFGSRTTALGFSGEFRVNGQAVSIAATDSLNDIVSSINAVNVGTSASGVSASVIETSTDNFLLILTSDQTGAAGINVADGPTGILRTLGFLDSTASVKTLTSDGAKSDGFTSSTTTVGTLLGLATPPASGSVTLGPAGSTFLVAIDLANDSLEDISTAITTAGASSGVTSQVITETDADGVQVRRLDISGTTDFVDDGGILESLGILEGGRSAAKQQIRSNAFENGSGGPAATSTTKLVDLFFAGGSSAKMQVGDTLSITGTRADGSTFTKTFTVADAADDLDDILTSLNSAVDGFKVGSATATASISGGRLIVTDDSGGDSQLALSLVANNEIAGSTVDFGAMGIVDTGRNREIAAGADAHFQVDGGLVTRSSNTVTDIIEGVTLTLNEASSTTVAVQVDRNVSAITASVQSLVDAFNTIQDFVAAQFSGAGADDEAATPPLSGNSTLRQIRGTLRGAMQTTIGSEVGGSVTRLSDVGIEISRTGTFTLNTSKLETALADNPQSVERLFGVYGAGSVSALELVSSSADTEAGSYSVNVTQAATQVSVTGTGFGGTYVDDATADTLTVRDVGTNSQYHVSLTNGMTLAQIVDALNTEFTTSKQHQLQASEVFYSDAIGTIATDNTTLDSIFNVGGTNFGIANDDVITISGSTKDGTSIFRDFTITDVTTQTLGDLRAEIASTLKNTATVAFQSGALTATARDSGLSSMTLSITSDNAGGGTLTFGTVSTQTAGRDAVDITASDSGGELELAHGDYGSAAGFEVSYTAGGTDGSASLGLSAGTTVGLDVQGTIGGLSATGTGQILQGEADTAVEGLMIRVDSADTGVIGTFTFSRGLASVVELATDLLLGSETGSIQTVLDLLGDSVERIQDQIDALQDRLEVRRTRLLKRFANLEEALARAQAQGQFFTALVGSL